MPAATAAAANFTTYNFTTEAHGHLTPFFAALQASCITADQMAQGPFLPPLTNEKLLPWWRARMAEARAGQRVIVLLLPDLLGPTAQKPQGADFRGIAMMSLSPSETGTARCHIDCLLVDRKYRRQGGAKALVQALEYEAGKRGRTLLVSEGRACCCCCCCCCYGCYGWANARTWPWEHTVGRHRGRHAGRGRLQEIRLHRGGQGAAVQPRRVQPADGPDLFLQRPLAIALFRLGA